MKHVLVVVVFVFILDRLSDGDQCTVEENHFQFRRMVYHNGYFYTSGDRCLCRLNMSLDKEHCVGITQQNKTMYDALLIVDKENGTLIACGTGTDVSCQVLTLPSLNTSRNVSTRDDNITTSTVIGNGNKVIAFISWGVSGGQNETVLYTATNNTNNTMLSPLSVRSLRGQNMFQLFNQNGTGSRIELVDDENKKNNPYFKKFEPVGGFAYDGMAYFITNQLKDANSVDSNQQSKLIRLCQNDTGANHWLTYNDIAITCNERSKVVSANLLPVGKNLRESLDTNYSHVMLAQFDNAAFSLCLYTFDRIGIAFDKAESVDDANRYLKPTDTSTCQNSARSNPCNASPGCRNVILAGNITGHPVMTFDSNLISGPIASGSILNGSFTVILVRNDSHVNAYYLDVSSSLVLFRELSVKNKIHLMKIIDDEVYLLENTEVIRESLNNSIECSNSTSARTCINQGDPFCGWCRTKTSCTTLSDCGEEESWLSVLAVNTLGEFSTDSVWPDRGPLSGGTSITITGENFDLYKNIKVQIGDNVSATIETRNGTTLTYLTLNSRAPALLNISIILSDENDAIHANLTFEYLDDPTVASISPNRSFASGGRILTVVGSNFDIIKYHRIQFVGGNKSEGCNRTANNNNTVMTCRAPEAPEALKRRLEEGERRRSVTEGICGSVGILCVEVEFQMDGVNRSLLRQTLELTRDPVFYNFTEEGGTKQYSTDARSIVIMGERLNISAKAAEYDVTVGKQTCDVLQSKLSRYEFHCLPPAEQPQPLKNESKYPEVWVRLGNIERHVGFLHYLPPEEEHYVYLYILVGILCVTVAVLIVVGVLLRRRNRRAVKKLQNDMQDTEMRIQTEFRQVFADLQTDMTDITGELVETGLPYHSFPVYAFQILFPADDVTSMTSHKLFNYPETSRDVTDVDTAMMKLDELFQNKFFVLSIIDTLEKEKKLTLSEKASLASCVSTLLVHDLNLFSQLVKGLLKQYVTDVVLKKKQKSLFRRCQSITEKMTEMWLGVCLHDHLLDSRGGSALIMMVKAIQTVMMKSPIDAVTDAARATLSYEQLLLCPVDNDDVIRLQVMINDGACQCSCAVLACDSIGQVKAKCLGVMYKKDPASKRPTKNHVELQWHCGKQGRLILEERDRKPSEDNCVKLMTLADYHVTDGALMELLNKEVTDEEEEYANIQLNAASQNDVNVLIEEEIKDQDKEDTLTSKDKVERHLAKQDGGNVENKLLPEVHLSRLLQTKLNVKEYVDEALDSALDRKDIPVVVKFIYTELEELASRMGVDNNTLLSWKNNCFPIRFWGQLIQKPGIIFDVDVPSYLKPSLDVVATTFRDSFIPAQPLSKNSAPHKLLFYKDQEDYRHCVKSFHRAVTNTPSLDQREFEQHMNELSGNQKFAVNRTSVLYEIYKVLVKFKVDIVDGLEEDPDASRLNLPEKLEHVFEMMDGS